MDFYEFFAGGGMARLGLGDAWHCLFANDINARKADSYRENFAEAAEFHLGDIADVSVSQLAGRADLAWASFPCQDLSLAGAGAGLQGKRSGVFWEFWRLVRALRTERRQPRVVILENVYGAITSHRGADLAAICQSLVEDGYRYAPLVVDAAHFLPHSRPRLFIVGFAEDVALPLELLRDVPVLPWHPEAFALAYDLLSETARAHWLWLDLPKPEARTSRLVDLIEDEPTGVEWHTVFETKKLLSMMTPMNADKVKAAIKAGTKQVGAIYKRTRVDEQGVKRQRAEVRFDDVAGCLRTPAGGSSRQIILVVEGQRIRSRLLSPREAARLMGIPDTYVLPKRYNEAYHLAGDGVAVPVVSWLARHLVEPILTVNPCCQAAA